MESRALAQRGHLFCWVPVFLGIGIGLYFQLRFEPTFIAITGIACLMTALALLSRFIPTAIAPFLIAFVLIGGVGLAKWRTEDLRGPVLSFRYCWAIQGRIVNIDRSGSDAVRLTLDRVVLNRMAPDRTPVKVRVSVHGDGQPAAFQSGDVVMTTGHLSPHQAPQSRAVLIFYATRGFCKSGASGIRAIRLCALPQRGRATDGGCVYSRPAWQFRRQCAAK